MFRYTYGKIILIDATNKKQVINESDIIYCDSFSDYMKHINTGRPILEIVGAEGQWVKPYFDIDKKLAKNIIFDEMTELIKYMNVIQEIFKLDNSKNIYILRRPPRDIDDNMIKYSYHFIVDKFKIKHKDLKTIIKNKMLPKEWDTNCYSTNQGITVPYSDNKIGTYEKVPAFKPYCVFKKEIEESDVDITKYCISYISEDFKEYILPEDIPKKEIEVAKTDVDENEDDISDDEEEARKSEAFYKEVTRHVLALSKNRATEYSDWLEICMCIINIGKKYKWKHDYIIDLCNKFSMKDVDAYNEDDNMSKIYSIMGKTTRKDLVGYKRLLQRVKEDNMEYYKKNVIQGYKEVKEEFEKEYFFINNPLSIYRTPRLPRVIIENSATEIEQQLKVGELKTQQSNVWYQEKKKKEDKNGNVTFEYTKKQFVDVWLKDPDRATYEGIIFRPSGLLEAEKPYYKNLFTGFKADNILLREDADYSKIEIILNHLKDVYCAGVQEHYEYLLKWLAKIISDPENRPQVALVFYNEEHGTGRNTFTNFFMNDIIGHQMCASIRKIDRVFNRFNSILAKCMFMVVEEASGELKLFMEDLKNLITEPNFLIEKKNIDVGTYKNYISAMFLTNNRDILDIDDRDRRFAIFESSDCKKGDTDYFNRLHKCMQNKQNQALFIKYLKEEVDYSWSTAEFQKYRPITKAMIKQISLNCKNPMKFVSHIVSEKGVSFEFYFNCDWYKYKGAVTALVKKKDLYCGYKKMCEYYKYTAYTYDKFVAYITSKNTGITLTIRHKQEYYLINKDIVLKWVETFRNTSNEPIEEYDITQEEGYESDGCEN